MNHRTKVSLPHYYALLATTLSALTVQVHAQALKPAGREDSGTKRILSLASTSPPAIEADALLMLADLQPNADPKWREAQIQKAFRLGATVPQQYQQMPVPIGFTDSVPAGLALSSERKVDSLSLRLRAIRAMLDIEPPLARRMLAETILPPFPHLTCQDLTVPDLRLYYTVIAEVAQRAFTTEEVRKGLQNAFLLSYIRDVRSPLQVFPSSMLLTEVKLDSSNLRPLLNAWAEDVRSIRGDDRAFSVAFFREQSTHELRTVVALAEGGAAPVGPILIAASEFYEQQLHAPHRCQDTSTSVHLAEREADGIKLFNALAAQYRVSVRVTPVQQRDLSPAAMAKDQVRASPEFRHLLVRFQPTNLAPKNGGAAAARAALIALVHDIDAWGPPGNLEREGWFILKRDLLVRAVQSAVFYPDFHGASDAYIHFLEETADLRTSYTALWLDALSHFLDLSRQRGVEWTNEMLTRLNNSRDSVLALYGTVDSLIERLSSPSAIGE